MGFLRLAVQCAVINHDNHVLLSQRGDLGVWNLPGGRLDAGEPLDSAAAREVREETGVEVADLRLVNLYYAQGWERLNILFRALPIGGCLRRTTDEARDNRYFSPQALPPNTLWPSLIADALAQTAPDLRVLSTPAAELRRVKWQLRRRWLLNLLRGRPEPRHVRFDIQATAIIFDPTRQYLLTLAGARARVLPRVLCDGATPPWQQLARSLTRYGLTVTRFQWAGVWQNVADNSLEFIFTATMPEEDADGVEWSPLQNAALMGQDANLLALTTTRPLPWLQLYRPQPAPLILEQN